MPADQNVELTAGRAQEMKLARIELRRRGVEQRRRRHAVVEDTEYGAIAGRNGGELVGERQAAAARNVLRNDARVAGDMIADMADEQASHGVVDAADAGADLQKDRLAAIELGGGLGCCRLVKR